MNDFQPSPIEFRTGIQVPSGSFEIRLGRLHHLNPEAGPLEGFVDDPEKIDESFFTLDDLPQLYRYTIAKVEPTTRIRITGLLVAAKGLNRHGAPLTPAWIAIDSNDLDTLVAGQGTYLGNIVDSNRILHRLEGYSSPALVRPVSSILEDSPGISILSYRERLPDTYAPLLITSITSTASCLEPSTQRPTRREYLDSLDWLTRWFESILVKEYSADGDSEAHQDTSAILARVSAAGRTLVISEGDRKGQRSTLKNPPFSADLTVSWNLSNPNLLRALCHQGPGSPAICTSTAITPARAIMHRMV